MSDQKLVTLVEKLLDRVEKLETSSRMEPPMTRPPFGGRGQRRDPSRDIVCWNCGKRGHVSRVCNAPKLRKTTNPWVTRRRVHILKI